MTTFKHKDFDIALELNGSFSAVIANKRVTKPSLAAMKKHIDNIGRDSFKPFQSIHAEGWADQTLRARTIVGTRREGRNSRARTVFVDDKGGTYREVTPDTPENRAALQAVIDHRRETRRLHGERQETENDLTFLVPTIRLSP